MKAKSISISIIAVLALLLSGPDTASVGATTRFAPVGQGQALPLPVAPQPDAPLARAAGEGPGVRNSPVMFIENVGQFDDGARFQVRGADKTIWLAEFNTSINSGDSFLKNSENSNTPIIEWIQTLGSPGDDDLASRIQQVSDVGYIMIGSSLNSNTGDFNAWLVRLDSQGNLIWQKNYGNTISDFGATAEEIEHHQIFVAGTTQLPQYWSMYKPWVFVTNEQGELQWQSVIDENTDQSMAIRSGQVTKDGGYILTGVTHGYMYYPYLVKINSLGQKQWSTSPIGADGVIETNDGNYIVAGSPPCSYWSGCYGNIAKYDQLGNQIWSYSFNASHYPQLGVVSFVQKSDSQFLVGGHAGCFTCTMPYYVGWLAQINNQGTIVWEKTFSDITGINFIKILPNGYLIFIAENNNHGPILVGSDSMGNILWEKSITEIISVDKNNFAVKGLELTNDNGYILIVDAIENDHPIGMYPKDVIVIKLSAAVGYEFSGTILPIYPFSHSIASTVMQGGTAYRYFRLLDANGNPIPNATVTLSVGSSATSDASGYFTATIPTSALGSLGNYSVSIQSVTIGGQTYTTNNQPAFTVQVTERRYSHAWSYGASTRAKGGISAGYIAYLQRTTNGGLELKLDESNPDATSDDVILMKEDFSDETGIGGGVGIEKGVSVLILQIKGGGEATSEFALRTIGNTQTRFPNPYSDDDRKAEGVYLLASVIDSMIQASPGKPFAITFLKLAIDRNAPYSSYISQQQAGFGSKITPLQFNVGASASLGLKRSGNLWKAAPLGFELVDVGKNVVQMIILTDYRDRNEWGLGYEAEHNVDFTLLSPSAEVGKFKAKLGWFMNDEARKVRVELFFDSNTNALKRLELAFTGDGNAGAFGGTIEEATAKISIPASQLSNDRLTRTVNILRLLLAAQQTDNNPLQIGSSAMINELNNLLSGLGYAEYEYTIDDGAQKRFETELGVTALIKIELGPSFEVKQVRSLVRERGVFTSGQFYTTESYTPDSIVSRAGKSWQDLTVNALGGLWLLVQDAFNWVSQQVSSGVGWGLNILSRTAAGVTRGGAQLTAPPGTQLQRLSPQGAHMSLTDPITVTAISWVPTSKTAATAPHRLKADLAVATGEGFVVGGIYEFQPHTMTMSLGATLVITYTDEAAIGVDESRIGMFSWNPEGNNWQPISAISDPAHNIFTASITQLGTFALGYDATPPQISILEPADRSIITNTLPLISALVVDTGVGIDPTTVEMQLDGQVVDATYITGTGELMYLPAAPLAAGQHTLVINARDVLGNQASSTASFSVGSQRYIYLPLILRSR